jgi:N-acetyl-anhydromuramyl-L-alanine amidase AmpD
MEEIEETIKEAFNHEYSFTETINLMTNEELKEYISYYAKKQVKKLTIQRELLNEFQKHYQSDAYDDEMSFDWNVTSFLKAFNIRSS